MFCNVMLFHTILSCAVLCYDIVCYVMSYYATACSDYVILLFISWQTELFKLWYISQNVVSCFTSYRFMLYHIKSHHIMWFCVTDNHIRAMSFYFRSCYLCSVTSCFMSENIKLPCHGMSCQDIIGCPVKLCHDTYH